MGNLNASQDAALNPQEVLRFILEQEHLTKTSRRFGLTKNQLFSLLIEESIGDLANIEKQGSISRKTTAKQEREQPTPESENNLSNSAELGAEPKTRSRKTTAKQEQKQQPTPEQECDLANSEKLQAKSKTRSRLSKIHKARGEEATTEFPILPPDDDATTTATKVIEDSKGREMSTLPRRIKREKRSSPEPDQVDLKEIKELDSASSFQPETKSINGELCREVEHQQLQVVKSDHVAESNFGTAQIAKKRAEPKIKPKQQKLHKQPEPELKLEIENKNAGDVHDINSLEVSDMKADHKPKERRKKSERKKVEPKSLDEESIARELDEEDEREDLSNSELNGEEEDRVLDDDEVKTGRKRSRRRQSSPRGRRAVHYEPEDYIYHRLLIYTDGAARGNPGESGAGVVLKTPEGEEVGRFGRYLGRSTNNYAEYQALLLGLQHAQEFGAVDITILSDSDLLVRQLCGEYRVRATHLRNLFDEAQRMLNLFDKYQIKRIEREKNREADSMANRAIDEKL